MANKKSLKRPRLLRNKEGKLVVRLTAYSSPRAHLGFVVPRGYDIQKGSDLPKAAEWANISFIDAETKHTLMHLATKLPAGKERERMLKRGHRTLPRSIVEKMVFG